MIRKNLVFPSACKIYNIYRDRLKIYHAWACICEVDLRQWNWVWSNGFSCSKREKFTASGLTQIKSMAFLKKGGGYEDDD